MATHKRPNDFSFAGDVLGMLEEIVTRFHPELHEFGVTFFVVFAFGPRNEKSGELTGPAISAPGGYPALAEVKRNNELLRVQGLTDVTIRLDGDRWPDLSRRRQMALLDHEVTHVEVVTIKKGVAMEEPDGRPKIALRKHDVQMGWFAEIARRHGEDSCEIAQAHEIVDAFGQVLFPWLAPAEPAEA